MKIEGKIPVQLEYDRPVDDCSHVYSMERWFMGCSREKMNGLQG